MMAVYQPVFLFLLSNLVLLLSILPVVRGDTSSDQSLTGLVVACAIALILFIVIIVVFVMVLTWNMWFPAIQRSKGRVKLPRNYWQKKKEAKQRLLMNISKASRVTASTTVPRENGAVNGSAILANRAKATASWVQGWNIVSPPDDNAYEDVSLTMDLGEEKEEPEFRIETSVVDDETLDLGPFNTTEEDLTYTAVLPHPRPQPTPTAEKEAATTAASIAAAEAVAAATATETAATPEDVATTSEQAITMQLDDDDEEEEAAPKIKSFYMTPLMSKPRQVTSSDTPAPPPLPPPPPKESYAQFLDSAAVAF